MPLRAINKKHTIASKIDGWDLAAPLSQHAVQTYQCWYPALPSLMLMVHPVLEEVPARQLPWLIGLRSCSLHTIYALEDCGIKLAAVKSLH